MNRSIRTASRRPSARSLSLAAMEAVEARRLLASVSGVVFNDANANGTRQAGEAGLNFEVVYADRNNNGTYDGTDVATRTDANGKYTLANLPADGATITVRVRGETGTRVVSPAGNGYAVKLTAAAPDVTGKDFAVRPVAPATTTVGGTLFNDANGNGKRDAGEAGIAGYKGTFGIYADLNRNGVRDANEPIGESADGGSTYSIANVPVGATFDLRFAYGAPTFDGAYYQTRPAGFDMPPLTVTTATAAPITTADFGFARGGHVNGVAFLDANHNGSVDANETTPAAGAIWLDLDGDHVRDAGEPLVPSPPENVPDNNASGLGVPFGTYVVAFGPSGAIGTTATAFQTVTVLPNAPGVTAKIAVPTPTTTATLAGRVTNDANANGVADAGEAGLNFEVVYLDRNNNGAYDAGDVATRTDANGNYAFANVALDGSTVAVRLRGIAAPRKVTAPAGGAYVLTLKAGATKTNLNFSVAPAATSTLTGFVYFDANGNGKRDAGEAYSGVRVYADLNGNGYFDADEPSDFIFYDNADGHYAIAGVPTGRAVTVRVIDYANPNPASPVAWANASSAFEPTFTVTPTASTTTVGDFVRVHAGAIDALVFYDADGNGTQQNYEYPDISLEDVWLDVTPDGVHGQDEPSLAHVDPADADPVGNRSLYFIGAPAGTYTVAVRFFGDRDGTADLTRTVTVAGVGSTAIASFAIPTYGPLATGVVYNDANGNGVKDANEAGIALAGVYADYNNNGVFDPGEPNVATDAGGVYYLGVSTGQAFTLRATGSFNRAPTGVASPKSYPLSFTSDVTKAGLNFGVAPNTPPPTTATVNGRVNYDLNRNADDDLGEPGIAGLKVFADYNGNGIPDANEPTATTSAAGTYALSVKAGTFAVRLLTAGSPYAQSVSAGDSGLPVSVAAGGTVDYVNFAAGRGGTFATQASIGGVVYTDTNGNGVQDAGEPGRAGELVYLLLDGGTASANVAGELHAVTDATGHYLIAGVPSQDQPVRVVLASVDPADVTGPASHVYTGHLNGTYFSANNNFGVAAAVPANRTIEGIAFVDVNGDGLRGDPSLEPLLGYHGEVFADYNDNGVRDADEPTDSLAGGGNYVLSVPLNHAAFTLRAWPFFADNVPAGTVGSALGPIAPGGAATLRRDFAVPRPTPGGIASGFVFVDANGNGRLDAGERAGSVNLYADLDGDGVQDGNEPGTYTTEGQYFFYGLPTDGSTIAIRVQGAAAGTPLADPKTVRFTGPNAPVVSGLNFAEPVDA